MSEPKPCPCGGQVYAGELRFTGEKQWSVGCLHCDRAVRRSDKAEAIAAWNRRASPTTEGQGGGEDARRSSEWLRAYAQSSFTTIEEADRLHTAANELDRLSALLSSPRGEEVRREALDALELIEVDLEAGVVMPKVRVARALSRTKAWLAKFRALSLQVEGTKS